MSTTCQRTSWRRVPRLYRSAAVRKAIAAEHGCIKRSRGTRALALLGLLLALFGATLHADEPKKSDAQTVHRNTQELWRSSIAAPPDTSTEPSLSEAADAVQAIVTAPQRAKPPAQPPRGLSASAPATTAGPAIVGPNAVAVAVAAQTQPAGPPPLEPNTLARLKLAPAAGPIGKVALADALFSQDQLDAAAELYKDALAQDKEGHDKDWILFQLGNSLREKDAAAARTFYKRVSAECPGSAWATLAATECQYLDHQQEPTTKPASTAARGTGARSTPPAAGSSAALGASRAVAAAPKMEANAR
jgi:hypothetical protein